MTNIEVDVSAAPGFGLHWQSNVPRDLVHRRSMAEVVLASVTRLSHTEFLAAAQWPCSHPTYPKTPDGRHSPVMVAETARQLGLAVPQLFLGAGSESHFVINDMRLEIDPDREPREVRGASDVLVRTDFTWNPAAGPQLRSFTIRTEFVHDGGVFAHCEGSSALLSPAVYRRLRSGAPGLPDCALPEGFVRPHCTEVGAVRDSDVVIARNPAGDVLIAPCDLRHPYFFDHVAEHVPGILLLEAARQAALLSRAEQTEAGGGPAPGVVGMRMETAQFTDWEPLTRIDGTPMGSRFGFTISQGSLVRARGEIALRPR
ncbi:AfsA-related hotdog domain-containing protein [Streptomyces monticola]|uniref:AfsA-related hotdog domain-containing protein n=1 Tax=Streptomyces monticola TaxID=2666263 RepID=A0ABW2JY86_9ACTN